MWRGRCAGGKLQKARRILMPLCSGVGCPRPKNFWGGSAGDSERYSARPANFQRGIPLVIADRLFERQNNQPPAQTGDQNRRPIIVIADLNCDDLARIERADLGSELARLFFDLSKRPRDLAGCTQNGRLITFL